jgi:uncharacterized protein
MGSEFTPVKLLGPPLPSRGFGAVISVGTVFSDSTRPVKPGERHVFGHGAPFFWATGARLDGRSVVDVTAACDYRPLMSTNRLGSETSPYLLQHARNPVDWYPWGDEAFARARAEGKPVLLSIGYSACHWCHVMERECFEDERIAGLMNRLFVNIKVDREERPDVDDVYMKAVQLLIGRGGWPMTVFLTPEREPFYGGTYFPPVDRHGLPGFPRVLQGVAQAFREKPEEIRQTIAQLVAGIEGVDRHAEAGGTLDPGLPLRAAQALMAHVDLREGGLGDAPKFPHTQAFQLLLRQSHRAGQEPFRAAAVLAGEKMGRGGVYDQIGGGFHRYAVDAAWRVPHFEKMLYDNAQLPRLYIELWQATGSPYFRTIAEETLRYLLRDMRHSEGGFFAATDADSEGVEGKYFVWSKPEVDALLPPEQSALVCRFWDVTDGGNFEGQNIPHVTVSMAQAAALAQVLPEQAETAIAQARVTLLAARSQRVPPQRDEKILTAWNGLTISALAAAGAAFSAPEFVRAATTCADFLFEKMYAGDRLLHGWAAGMAKGDAFLDDHAFLANACIDLFEATGHLLHLSRASQLLDALEARFHDPTGGAYFFTPNDGERLLTRTKPGADGAVPAGNAVAALALLRMHYLGGDPRHLERAEEVLRLYHPAAAKNPFGFATYLEALELYAHGPTEIVLVGELDSPSGQALWQVVGQAYVPGRLVVPVRPDPPAWLKPAEARPALGGRPTAYVCRQFTCAPPVTTPEALRELLRN